LIVRFHMAANYQGYGRARALESQLAADGHDVVWHASPEFDDNDDYTIYAIRAAQAVIEDEDAGVDARGIIVGGTGAAEAIVTNKVAGVRAVHTDRLDVVVDARQHADVTILVLGADVVDDVASLALIEALVSTPFLNNLDDARRVVNVAEFEASGTIEGWMIEYTSGSSGSAPSRSSAEGT